jgi:quercetin dioxygenase-like cupin family protein
MSIMDNELVVTNLLDLRHRILELGIDVVGAKAKGVPVHTNGHLGVDVLRVEAGDSFPIHTHEGDHLLLCLEGKGTISIAGKTYHVVEGDIYMVAGMTPHAVGAASDSYHVLAAIGAPHKAIDSPNRMTATDWDGNIVESAIYL